MGINIEIARQKLYSTYGIDVDKYTKDETIDQFEQKLDSILSFGFASILPVVISGVTALLSAVLFSFIFESAVFGVLFFIFSLPIFLIGVGAIGIAKATENLYEGVSFILAFSINITKDIKKIIIKNGKINTNPKDLSLLILYGIVFPIVKRIIRKKPLGGAFYFIIEKVVNKCFVKMDFEINEVKTEGNVSNKNGLFTVSEKVKSISKSALKSIILILKTIGIVFIILGFILILLLFLIFLIL